MTTNKPLAGLLLVSILLMPTAITSATAQENEQAAQQQEQVAEAAELSAEEAEAQYLAWAQGMWDSFDIKTGAIPLDSAKAVLNVPESFYFLGAEDSRKVLEEAWGNPPGAPVLGMLFPADLTPFDGESWAVTIEYEEDGYVSDADADEIDYEDLLTQMKADTAAESEQRIAQGYESIELVGWAATPYYDATEKKLHWAKEIRFGDTELNTLNYNIRVLGRSGVLVLNFVAGIDQKTIIDGAINDVLAMAEFEQGAQYADFDPDVDKVAAYGMGALVAGKILAKTGFLAVALVFLKKFGVFILLGIGALIKGLFSRSKNKTVQDTD